MSEEVIMKLDELLNTLATSSLEPHGKYTMEFSNKDQTIIYEYIKKLQQENKELKELVHKKYYESDTPYIIDIFDKMNRNKINKLQQEIDKLLEILGEVK